MNETEQTKRYFSLVIFFICLCHHVTPLLPLPHKHLPEPSSPLRDNVICERSLTDGRLDSVISVWLGNSMS